MGLYSPISATRRVTSLTGSPSASASSRWPVREVGRNSCSGGSNRRMQTGWPSMMRNSWTKSSRCIGSSRSSTAARPAGVSAKIISRITTRRAGSKNMCSVRQRPMPPALKLRAVWASSGVSALARMPMSRSASAQPISVWKASSSAASSIGGSPTSTCPVVPSMVITSPLRRMRPSGALICWFGMSNCSAEAPTMQGRPMPRPITAACEVMPPRSVRTATEACIPRMSSGEVSRRTSTQGSRRAALAWASFAVKTMRPEAAPGLAAMPVASTSRGAVGSTWRCSSSVSWFGSTRISASCGVMIPSSASRTAMRTLARDERGTRTPSRIWTWPPSMTNSTCISSRSFSRIRAALALSWAKASGATSSSDGPRGSFSR